MHNNDSYKWLEWLFKTCHSLPLLWLCILFFHIKKQNAYTGSKWLIYDYCVLSFDLCFRRTLTFSQRITLSIILTDGYKLLIWHLKHWFISEIHYSDVKKRHYLKYTAKKKQIWYFIFIYNFIFCFKRKLYFFAFFHKEFNI